MVLRNEDSLALLQQDMTSIERTIDRMWPLAETAGAVSFARAIRVSTRRVVGTMSTGNLMIEAAESVIAEFATLRERVGRLT